MSNLKGKDDDGRVSAMEQPKSGAISTDDPAVAEALRDPLFDYRRPLETAWGWNRNGKPDDQERATALLAALVTRFPHVEKIWYEQAFNLMRVKPPKRAETLAHLQKMSRVFGSKLSEDTLSLWARCHKDEGDEWLTGNPPDLALAEEAYARAEAKYTEAYGLRHDRFPGINKATMAFLRSGLLKQLADDARKRSTPTADLQANGERLAKAGRFRVLAIDTARELLSGEGKWASEMRLKDDPIWIGATAAEAYLLLADDTTPHEWEEAATRYERALQTVHAPQPFHFDSIVGQVRRLLAGHERLGMHPLGRLADYRTFFGQLAAQSNISWITPN